MALATGTIWEMRDSATTGNVNGGGFNINNAAFITDFTATSATGNAPVIATASYNFAASDVNAWIYVRSGTNWTPGYYQITSVAANAATVNATIGAALQLNTITNMWVANTVAGVATVASPTAGTCGVDYSQQNTAQTTATDFAAVGASTTLTSATAAFTPVMVGNIFHQTTTGTGAFGVVGWYEIATYVNATTVTLDRTPNSGTASVATTGFVGGAGRLNGLEDAFYEAIPASSIIWIKSGTYTLSANINVASTTSTAILMSVSIGYTTLRGDTCNGTNRPIIVNGSNSFTSGQAQSLRNIRISGSGTVTLTMGASSYLVNCFLTNTSSTATRTALNIGSSSRLVTNCEFVSQNGVGVGINAGSCKISGCYIHSSSTGISSSGNISVTLIDCIFENCITAGISNSNTAPDFIITTCTFYGTEAKTGTAILFSGANVVDNVIYGNIIYGWTTGISVATGPAGNNVGYNNDFFNNTTDVSNWYKDPTNLALNPQFVNASQITGTTGSGSGSVMTDTNANFSTVTDNVDYLYQISGTGATVGMYLITGHTTTTLTVNNAVGTNATADRSYFVGVGHNFQIGANLAGQGYPNFTTSGSETTSYPDVGAVQRQFGSLNSSTFAYTFGS